MLREGPEAVTASQVYAWDGGSMAQVDGWDAPTVQIGRTVIWESTVELFIEFTVLKAEEKLYILYDMI